MKTYVKPSIFESNRNWHGFFLCFILQKLIDVLKIDVESAELEELNYDQTLQWLSKYAKVILLEWHPTIRVELAPKAFQNTRNIGFKSFFTEFRYVEPDFLQVESLISTNLVSI